MKFNRHANYIFRCMYFQKTLRYLCFLFVFLLWYGCSQNPEEEKELLREYNVTFLSDLGNVFTSVKIPKESTSDRTLSQPSPNPVKEGFVFEDWYADPLRVRKFYFNSKRISSNLRLYAKWKRIRYTINFITFGGNDISPIEVESKSIADIPNSPEKEFSVFDHWYIDQALTVPFNKNLPVLHDLTLYAKWKTRTYNFVFYSNGGSSIDTQTIPSGGKVEKPKDPVKDGFAFLGWFRTLDNYSPKFNFENTKIISRLWVYAKWTEKKVSISYNAIDGYFLLEDGSVRSSISETKLAGTKATYRVPKRGKRFQFVAWYTDRNFQKKYDFPILQEDIKLYAKWEPRKFKVVFKNLNGVKKIPTQNITYNKKAQRPDPDPVKLNSKFIGWHTSLSFNQEYDFKNTAILEDKNVYAYFLVKWDVTFNLLEGTIKDSTDPVLLSFTQGSSIIPPNNPIKEGYTFLGWTRDNVTGSTLYDLTLPVNNNITLYAKWASSVAVIKSISLFKSSNLNANFEKDVYIASSQRKKIRLTAPNIDLKRIVPSFIYSGVYSSTPALDAPQDFSKSPIIYQLTAEDKSITEFNVSVSNSANTEKQIFLFQINASENPSISNTIVGNIIENQKIIEIVLPRAVDAESLKVYIETSYAATVSPASKSIINLNKLSYLVTAEDKSFQTYTLDIQRIKSIDKDIRSFTFIRSKNKTQNGDDAIAPGKIISVINGSNISVTLPPGSVFTNLSPTISSTGIRINPNPDEKQDFSNPLVYKVIAENLSTKDYTISVFSTLSSNNKILEFAFRREDNPILSQDYEGTVNSNDISIPLPEGIISRGPLTPYIRTESYVKRISPQGPRSFGNKNLYSVFAQDMSERKYILTITEKKSSIKDIISFVFDLKDNQNLSKTYEGQIRKDKVYVEEMPFGTNILNLKPTISILGGGTISPPSSIGQDFSNPQYPVTYTVTARDGSTKAYTVLLKLKSNPSKQITSFTLERRSNPTLNLPKDEIGRIDGDNIILVIRKSLLPLIGVLPKIVHNGQSISPEVTTAINLDEGIMVSYTVRSSNNSTQIYKVGVIPYGEDIALIDAFWLDKKFNSSLENTVSAVIDQESASITIDNAPSMLLKPDSQGNITITPSMIIRGKEVDPDVETPATLSSSGHLVFTVSSFNGNVSKTYALTINSTKSSEKSISSFSFDINKNSKLTSSVKGVINKKESRIIVSVPFGTDTSKLLPSLEIIGKSYEPIDAQDFGTKENPQKVEYIIYAENGSRKSYSVDLRFLPNTQAKILSFVFYPKDNSLLPGTVSGTIRSPDSDTPTISLMLPAGASKENLIPKISISKKASISPGSSSPRDFSNNPQYTVTSEDGSSTKTYTIAVSLKASDSKDILSFELLPEDNSVKIKETITGQISGGEIQLTVPFGTQIKDLLPRISTSGTSYTPTGKISFSTENGKIQPLTYTVVAEDKSEKVYEVNIQISDPVKYTISFSGDNVSKMEPITISKGEFLPSNTLPPDREGNTFIAWYKSNTNFNNDSYIVDNNTPIDSDLTLYPKWVIKTYTVTFISQGTTFNTVFLNFGDLLEPPSSNPNKDKYEFVGWFNDQTATTSPYNNFGKTIESNFGKTIKSNLTLYAGFSQNVFTISFISRGITYTADREKESPYNVPTNIPKPDGYTLIGWYENQTFSSALFDITSAVESKKTLYAKWGSNANIIESVLISTPPPSISITPSVSHLTNTIKATVDSEYINTLTLSYSLPEGARGSIDSGSQISLIPSSLNASLSAEIAITSEGGASRTYSISITPRYTITFNYSNYPSSLPDNETKKVIAGETISFPDKIPDNPTGYIFEGWFFDKPGNRPYDSTSKPSENITLYAKWEENFYTVTFISGGKIFTTQKISQASTNDRATNPKPTERNAIFGGWYKDAAFTNTFQFTTAIAADITLYARWKYKVTFNSKGTTAKKEEIYKGTPVSKPNLYAGNINFSGWYRTSSFNNAYDFKTLITGDLTLYAKWLYKITFNDGSSTTTDVSVTYGNTVSKPEPTKDKHVFKGWYTTASFTGTPYTFSTAVTSDLTLYAKFVKLLTVKFEMNGGTPKVEDTLVASGDKVTKPTDVLTKEGYTFADWYTTNDPKKQITKYDFTTKVTKVFTLYAKWKANTYKITFETGSGATKVLDKKADYNTTITKPTTPTKTGHTFADWYKDAAFTNTFDFGTDKVTSKLTLYAKWQIIKYTVNFVTNSKSSTVDNKTADYNTTITKPTTPTKTGHTFMGWYKDAAFTNTFKFKTEVITGDKIIGDLTLYAKWQITNYTITFIRNPGKGQASVEHGKSVTQKIDASILNPKKPNHAFKGWYTTKTFTGTEYDLATAVTGELTLYAKFAELFTVNFIMNEGAPILTDTLVASGDKVTEPTDALTKTGHTFKGWYTTASFSGAPYSFDTETIARDLTLYAKWKISAYTITFDSDGNISPRFKNELDNQTITPKSPNQYAYAKRPDPLATTKKDSAFLGWFAPDEKLPFDFEGTAITKSLTLTAKWEDSSKYIYDKTPGTISNISKDLNTTGTLIVPIHINGTLITGIGPPPKPPKLTRNDLTNIFDALTSEVVRVVLPHDMSTIGDYAFYSFKKLTSITIPDNVTSIGLAAFVKCAVLSTITFSDNSNLKTIGQSAFDDCRALKSITIPNSVTTIKSTAFLTCVALETVTFSGNSNLKTIGDRAFNTCQNLTTVTFSGNSNLKTIGNAAFGNCIKLASIKIPNSVTSIGDTAFFSCTALETVTFSSDDTLTTIGEGAFGNCVALKSIKIPESVTAIKANTFGLCTALTSITIPDKVTTIGDGAFINCAALSTVTFLDKSNLTTIGNFTFKGCTTLKSITIPNSVTTIGESAFEKCIKLETVTFLDNSKLKTIGDYAFEKCQILTKITLPANITKIGKTIFVSSSVSEIIINAINPPTVSNGKISASISSIQVPASSVDKYKKATGWSEYTIIEIIK